jgi:ATP-binding cassette subfamily E protein 1
MISDSIIVFKGKPSREGYASSALKKHEGMNLFLKDMTVTFRRDEESNRARINKLDSRLDREQKEKGVYYAL